MTITTASTLSEIKKASTTQLVELYNSIAPTPVKRFSTREAAENRTWKMIQSLPPEEDITPKKVAKKMKEKGEGKRDAQESKFINVLVTENPKRPDSRAHKKFAILMKFHGKTIKEYKAQEGKFPTLDEEKGWPATELRWAVRLELVKLTKEAPAETKAA